MWKDYELPLSAVIGGKSYALNADWRNIIDIFECLNANDLLFQERTELVLEKFYKNYHELPDVVEAINVMYTFINGNKKNDDAPQNALKQELRLIDWNKDLPLIIPPVNNVLKYDVRSKDFVHWWTFLGAFNEIGECSFNTYVNIRRKLAKREKLEKWERELYLANKEKIDIGDKIEYDNFDDEDILIQLAKKEYLIE